MKSKLLNVLRLQQRQMSPDFVLCMGDDRTDEQMFQMVETATQAHVSVCIDSLVPFDR